MAATKRRFKAGARTKTLPPFQSFKVNNDRACFGKQRHNLEREYVQQRVDYGIERPGRYSGKEVPDDLVFDACTNKDTKGNRCTYRVCVDMVEAF